MLQPFQRQDTQYYATASDAFPICIPLSRADLGGVRYVVDKDGDLDDLELMYELETSDLIIRSAIAGTKNQPPGTLRISNVKAADLSLFNEIPGSLEGIVSRLILETDRDILFQRNPLESSRNNLEEEEEEGVEIQCHKVVLIASVHECGHLRDILLFLKSDCVTDLIPESNPFKHSKSLYKDIDKEEQDKKLSLTFIESLPFWVMYVPWWLYSSRLRKVIQFFILLYTIVSVVWASWQLYRHFNIIQVALQPIVDTLKWYLSDTMEVLDFIFEVLTHFWTTFLSPLNIFRGIALAPIINVLTRTFTPIMSVFVSLWRIFTESNVVQLVISPLALVWQTIVNSRISVLSLDLSKLRLKVVLNLVIGSMKVIGQGFAKLFNFHTKVIKKNKAIRESSSSSLASSPSLVLSAQDPRRRNIPMYYSPPVSHKI